MAKRGESPYRDGYEDAKVGRKDPPPGVFPFSSTKRDHEKREDYERGRRDAKKDGDK